MRTLIPVVALLAIFAGTAQADPEDHAARLEARVRILQGRVRSLESVVEDQAVELAELRRAVRALQGDRSSKGKKAKTSKKDKSKKDKSKKNKKKADKKKADKKKADKKDAAKKAKKKAEKKAEKKDAAKKSVMDAARPRVPQVSVAAVERLQSVRKTIDGTVKKVEAAGDLSAETLAQCRVMLRDYVAKAEAEAKAHLVLLEKHETQACAELDARIAILERRIGEIESAHGKVEETMTKRIRQAGTQDTAGIRAEGEKRLLELRAQGETTEYEIRAIQAKREELTQQIRQGASAVKRALGDVHASAKKLEAKLR